MIESVRIRQRVDTTQTTIASVYNKSTVREVHGVLASRERGCVQSAMNSSFTDLLVIDHPRRCCRFLASPFRPTLRRPIDYYLRCRATSSDFRHRNTSRVLSTALIGFRTAALTIALCCATLNVVVDVVWNCSAYTNLTYSPSTAGGPWTTLLAGYR